MPRKAEMDSRTLADWLLSKRFVIGRTGHDWADRAKLDEIAKRLYRLAQVEEAHPSPDREKDRP